MPTIRQRIRSITGTSTGSDLARERAADAGRAIASARDDVAHAAMAAGEAVADVATDAGRTVTAAGESIAARVAHALADAGERLSATADEADRGRRAAVDTGARVLEDRLSELGSVLGRGGREIDATVRDAAARLTDGAPLDEFVRRLEREWPGTDGDRYQRAFRRGYARGRSGRLAVGLAVGAAGAAAGTYLLDPELGESRRAALVEQVRRIGERARHMLAERGITADAAQSMFGDRAVPTFSSMALGDGSDRPHPRTDWTMTPEERSASGGSRGG